MAALASPPAARCCLAGAARRARERRSFAPRAKPAQRRAAPRSVRTAAGEQQPREAPPGADSVRLMLAARAYAAQLDEGEDEEDEELVAKAAFGLEGKAGMNDLQRKYAGKIAKTLQEKAAAMAARHRAGSEAFVSGQFLYERGRYDEAVLVLEDAAREAGEQTQLGGDVSLWLALAYDANGQREQCLELYRRLQDTHASRAIRKQAGDLLYILEAPKLEIRADERVSIPVPTDATQYKDKWARAPPPRRKLKLSWEEEWLANYKPSVEMPNRFVLAATSVLCFCLAIYSAMHVRVHH